MNTILKTLKTARGYMSGVEKKIAEAILKDPKAFTGYAMAEFAACAGVSQGSIVNFAKKYAEGGFPSLKMRVAAALAEERPRAFSAVKKTDGVKRVMEKTAEDLCAAITNTTALNDAKTLSAVAERILRAKKVEIYGVFQSAVVATDFYYQLLKAGIPASFVSDVLTCAVSASMLDKDSLVVAVSSSGKTRDVLDAATIAKENGVPVVALTGHKDSPLAQLADYVLLAAPSGNSVVGSPTEIRIAQLAVTDTLCAYLRERTDADGKAYVKLKNILQSHNVKD